MNIRAETCSAEYPLSEKGEQVHRCNGLTCADEADRTTGTERNPMPENPHIQARLAQAEQDHAPLTLSGPHLCESLLLYGYEHVETGGFLRACLENDLRRACEKADFENRKRLFDIVHFIYQYLPGGCWGSPARVQDHLVVRNGGGE